MQAQVLVFLSHIMWQNSIEIIRILIGNLFLRTIIIKLEIIMHSNLLPYFYFF